MDRQLLLDTATRAMGIRKGLGMRETGYLLHHGKRTAAIALNLAADIGARDVDLDVLYAAALFHDIGKGIEPHAETGAALVRELLRDACGDRCEPIAELIHLHNKRRRPELPLSAHLLQDADILDHFGAQSVWLCCLYNGYTEQGPYAADAYYHGDENARYLVKSRELLNLEPSRAAFDRRLAVETAFFTRFHEEQEGAL